MVIRRCPTRIWRKRQQTDGLVITKRRVTSCQVFWPHSRSESHRVEPSLKWSSCFRWRNCWQMHKILEHPHSPANQLYRYRLSSVQLDVLQECQRDSQHPRVFSQSDNSVEVPINAKSSYSDWSYLQSALSFNESLWVEYRHRSWRWDSQVLERIPIYSQRKDWWQWEWANESALPLKHGHPLIIE